MGMLQLSLQLKGNPVARNFCLIFLIRGKKKVFFSLISFSIFTLISSPHYSSWVILLLLFPPHWICFYMNSVHVGTFSSNMWVTSSLHSHKFSIHICAPVTGISNLSQRGSQKVQSVTNPNHHVSLYPLNYLLLLFLRFLFSCNPMGNSPSLIHTVPLIHNPNSPLSLT